MRRLPVYILIDTSGSMFGEPIEAVKVGLNDMVATLRQDPYALETVWISIITFDREVKQLVPLTALEDLSIPNIKTPESGPTHTGAALKMMREQYKHEVRLGNNQQKGDWLPSSIMTMRYLKSNSCHSPILSLALLDQKLKQNRSKT